MTLSLLLLLLVHAPLVPFGGPWLGANIPEQTTSIPIVDSVEVDAFGDHLSGLVVTFGEDVNTYDVMAMMALPGETTTIEVTRAAGGAVITGAATTVPATLGEGGYDVTAAAGTLSRQGPNQWRWTAPIRSGFVPIEVVDRETQNRSTLNVFVTVPYERMNGGVLNGYRIGRYPAPRPRFADAYARPQGFIEVTAANLDTPVSPHFRLSQFVCKQPGGYPKYVIIQPELIAKLEAVLAESNARGWQASTFQLMSAFRTPFYNSAIGNKTSFSRHHYGDAADIFIDELPADGVMDDLNRDGRHNFADARALAQLVDDVVREDKTDFTGGLGTYKPTGTHGAFVHVDVRGYDARWGS